MTEVSLDWSDLQEYATPEQLADIMHDLYA